MPSRVDSKSASTNDYDLPYEEEIARNPYSLRSWLRFIDHKQHGTQEELFSTFERAIEQLPGSYKLWKQYLDLKRDTLEGVHPVKNKEDYQALNKCYERSLMLLNKMPRIWIDYLEFLTTQPMITQTRRTFDRALRALPLTQHARIWDLYLQFAKAAGGQTTLVILRRYLKLEPGQIEMYVDYLLKSELYDDAVIKMVAMVNDNKFTSLRGKSQYQLWQDLCKVMVEHCDYVKSVNVEKIIRSAMMRYTDQIGVLYSHLATYWIKMGQLEMARDIFEEGITTVRTVKDFTTIFDAYAEFEEEVLSAKMEMAQERESTGEEDEEETIDLDMRMLRFEQLMDRRPFLVNDVLLRQNPNNVLEWEKRVKLWTDNKDMVVETYQKAIETIDYKRAHGKYHDVWIKFAQFYEEGGDLDSARAIFEKAVKANYKAVNDLADVWCEYAEMETRHDDFDRALDVMARATMTPRVPNVNPRDINFLDESLRVQQRVFKSLRLWSFYVDLEESVGSVESTKAVYDKIMDLRIANPQTIVNYATFLEDHQYFEESYKVYERGIELFGWPVAFELWNIYLERFVNRYGGSKLERARDLFEQALDKCPPKYGKPIYLMYGRLEEEHGLAQHSLQIYDRATRGVSDEDRLEMYQFYIAKATESLGITAAREIYEKAIEALPDKDVRTMTLKYAALERKLGEIDRARAIYGYASQFFDPKAEPDFWQTWREFEVQHGNEDTFKEMLRIKRSVQAQYPHIS